MARLVKLAFALGLAVASGDSLRKRDTLVPDAANSTTVKTKDAAKSTTVKTKNAAKSTTVKTKDAGKSTMVKAKKGTSWWKKSSKKLREKTKEDKAERENEKGPSSKTKKKENENEKGSSSKTKKSATKKSVVAHPSHAKGKVEKPLASKLRFEGKDLTAFWNGRDFPEELLPLKVLAPQYDHKPKRNVHVFGLQDSGTSILKAYLYSNFGRKLNYFDSAFTTNNKANKRIGLWTFSNFQEVARLEHAKVRKLDDASVYAISVIRNPYAWLQAVHTGNVPVFMECVQGEDWLIRPCSHRSPGGPDSIARNMEFQSIAGVWNHWTEGFAKLGELGLHHNLVVKYEDLMLKPEEVLDQIAEFLVLKQPVHGWTIPFADAPEKEEPIALANDQAFMNKFIQKEKQQACVHLDPDVVELAGYKVFDCGQFTKGPARDSIPASGFTL